MPKLGKLRDKLRERRERSVERARAQAEAKREWERSGKIGRNGVHEGYSSSSF
jgi:hypothetical protein